MPPVAPRRVRPARREADPPPTNGDGETPTPPVREDPWSPASSMRDMQGLLLLLFGFPGCGKTTLGTTVTRSELGSPLLVVNFDEEVRSIADRDDIMVWPGVKQGGKVGSWDKANAFLTRLQGREHPFKSIMFDTLNRAAELALRKVRESGNPNRDGRQIFGEANDMVLQLVETWATLSRERGINVIFTCHAREVQEGENGPVYIRPDVTPGIVRGLYQKVSTIGYLEDARTNRPRKLITHNTARVVAKNHQPRSGPQVPTDISDPDLGKIIDHVRHVKRYAAADA